MPLSCHFFLIIWLSAIDMPVDHQHSRNGTVKLSCVGTVSNRLQANWHSSTQGNQCTHGSHEFSNFAQRHCTAGIRGHGE